MRFRLPVAVALSCALPLIAIAAPPSPESFLGYPVGADRQLAGYGQITDYFQALDRESDRVSLFWLGKSTLGRPMLMAAISSEANLRDLDDFKNIARKLADPRGLPPEEIERLVDQGKVILLVTCNIHSSEIGSSQMAMEWAYRLATSQSPEVRAWLDDVIVLLMPSINPDGTDMIVDYYRKFLGTEWEGGRLPWLYHHYAGHDNNRDWFMLNLVETRMVNRVLHHEWFPQVFLDEHQMGSTTPRMFVPPYADPHTPLVHPLQWRLNDLIGTHMALRLEQERKSGVIYSYAFDAYWPGGTKNTACLKNVVGLLTEVASCRIATPVYVDPNELAGGRKGLPEYKPQVNFPNPWPGGWWRLRDIIDYELTASNSLLETCSRYREEILRASAEMARDAVGRGEREAPYAYVIPADQHDGAAAAEMIELLREHGLEAGRARAEFRTEDGRTYPAGTVVFLAAQPYRPFLMEMMERQRYPEVRQGPDTKEIFRPYDVTAWTLPLLMGVDWARIDRKFDADLERLKEIPWPASGIEGSGPVIAIDPSSNQAAHAVNRLLAKGLRVARAESSFTAAERGFPAGTFLITAAAAAPEIETVLSETHVKGIGIAAAPAHARSLRAPRIGLYKPWAASMDEGWTRLVLERSGFQVTSLDNTAMKAKDPFTRFDVLILPDVDKDVIVDGRPKSEDGGYFEPLPPAYSGGIGKEGVANLEKFVKSGGVLVCLTSSCQLALDHLGLPVRNPVAKLKATEFSAPGTLVEIGVDRDHPIGWGMPEHTTAYVTGGPLFTTSVPGAGVSRAVVARYPEHEDQVVASGWAEGTKQFAGRAAVVEAGLGKGRVVLFGPRVQHRAQTPATYKLLFNAIYRGGMGK